MDPMVNPPLRKHRRYKVAYGGFSDRRIRVAFGPTGWWSQLGHENDGRTLVPAEAQRMTAVDWNAEGHPTLSHFEISCTTHHLSMNLSSSFEAGFSHRGIPVFGSTLACQASLRFGTRVWPFCFTGWDMPWTPQKMRPGMQSGRWSWITFWLVLWNPLWNLFYLFSFSWEFHGNLLPQLTLILF